MSDNQKHVAAWVAVAILVLAVVVTAWLAFTSAGQRYLDASDPDMVHLTTAWSIAAFFIKEGAVVNSVFAATLAVLSVAVTLVADIYTRKVDLTVICGLCIAGVVAAGIAMAQMSKTAPIESLRYYGEFSGSDAAAVAGMVKAFFGALIGWFGTFLAAALGISLTVKDGVLKGSPGTPPPPGPEGGHP